MLRRLAAAAAFDAFWVGHVVDSGRLIKREERKKEKRMTQPLESRLARRQTPPQPSRCRLLHFYLLIILRVGK